jgi:L-glyceraldehyde 3-phosphate reductase
LIHQPRFNLLDRWPEAELLPLLEQEGIGCIPFSPLAKGLLTNRYFQGIPTDSRAGHDPRFLRPADISEDAISQSRKLDTIAQSRGQTLAQMALAWLLSRKVVTSVLIGASKPSQVEDCVGAVRHMQFSPEELSSIDQSLHS